MSNFTLKEILTTKLSAVIMLLTLAWLISGFTEQLAVLKTKQTKTNTYPTINNVVLPQLTAHVAQQISNVYQTYKKSDVNEAKSTAMTAAEQLKQQGRLNKVFIGDNKLELKAVINPNGANNNFKETNDSLQALILVTNTKSNAQQITKFKNNTLVYGYQLIINKHTQVTLTKVNKVDKGEPVEQKIVLTMYKSNNAQHNAQN